MLHKIGLSKCIKDKLKYFKVYSPIEKITIDSCYKPIDNIVSLMISTKILEIDVINSILNLKEDSSKRCKTSFVNICLEVTFKIIYSSKDSKNLHIIDHKCCHVIKVEISSFIDGLTIQQLLNLKRVKPEVYIEDISVTLQNNRNLLISPFMLCEVLILPDYVLAYNIEMFNGENNLFVSYNDGSRLLQKTFNKNISYRNLTWCPLNTEIAYLSNEAGLYELYTLNINNRTPTKIKLDFHLGEVHSFCYTSNDTIVFSCVSNNIFELYSVNIKTLNTKKITNSMHGFSCLHPKFENYSNNIFFINKNPDGDFLASINEKGLDLNLICKKPCILDFSIHSSGKYVALLAKDEMKKINRAFIINSNGLNERNIVCIKQSHNIKKIAFSPEKFFLALCISYDNKDDIYFYDLKTNYARNITRNNSGIYISDFSFNFSGDKLYYSCSKRGNYDIYTIDLETFDTQSIINCFSKNISLVYKGI